MNRDREALRGLRNIATAIREKVLKPNATLQGREYVQLGIDLNNALDAANDILALPVGGGVEEPSAAIESLTGNQRQLDMDGCHVGVSRQALDEVLAYVAALSPRSADGQDSSSKPREES